MVSVKVTIHGEQGDGEVEQYITLTSYQVGGIPSTDKVRLEICGEGHVITISAEDLAEGIKRIIGRRQI